jgi:hypothetical protein
MDPFTALGAASAILTFIDFAGKILSGAYEIYQSASGDTAGNHHIEIIASDLADLATNLISVNPDNTNDGRALKDLASKCEVVARELQALLGTMKASGTQTTWKSFKTSIKMARKEKEVVSMEKRLGEYRAQILVRLLAMLR